MYDVNDYILLRMFLELVKRYLLEKSEGVYIDVSTGRMLGLPKP